MTINLSTARGGSEVTTHAGAKLVISETYPTDQGCRLVFEGYTVAYPYLRNGHRTARVSPDPMDIIAISPPPMSDAERLVENVARFKAIAKTARDMMEVHGFGYDYNGKLESIIELAGKD